MAQKRGRETNVARSERQCFNWFNVLAGLFEKIVKVLLGAIERQLTGKVGCRSIKSRLSALDQQFVLFNSRIGQIVTELLFLPRVLYLSKYAMFSRSWANTARHHKIWK